MRFYNKNTHVPSTHVMKRKTRLDCVYDELCVAFNFIFWHDNEITELFHFSIPFATICNCYSSHWSNIGFNITYIHVIKDGEKMRRRGDVERGEEGGGGRKWMSEEEKGCHGEGGEQFYFV